MDLVSSHSPAQKEIVQYEYQVFYGTKINGSLKYLKIFFIILTDYVEVFLILVWLTWRLTSNNLKRVRDSWYMLQMIPLKFTEILKQITLELT